MSKLVIPQAVQVAILGIRAHFRDLNARAQARNAQLQAADPVGNQIRIGFITKAETLGPELQFWNIEDDQALEDFLFDDLLAGLDPDMDWSTLPRGYPPLIDVLEFERHCQYEGWTAVSNKGLVEMARIIDSYRTVGLDAEARALAAVTEAYSRLADDDHPDFHDILRQAYAGAQGQTGDFDEGIENRLSQVLRFVRTHPDWFGVPARP
ncbi:MAG: hypothetical protein AB1421_14250 [Pseudomonadota bacterium]